MLNAPGDVDVDELGVNSSGLKVAVMADDGNASSPVALSFCCCCVGCDCCGCAVPNVMPLTRFPRPRISDMLSVSSANVFRSTVRQTTLYLRNFDYIAAFVWLKA